MLALWGARNGDGHAEMKPTTTKGHRWYRPVGLGRDECKRCGVVRRPGIRRCKLAPAPCTHPERLVYALKVPGPAELRWCPACGATKLDDDPWLAPSESP